MGLNFNDIRNLQQWRDNEEGGSVATLGRQSIFLHPKQVSQLSQSVCLRRKKWCENYKWGQYSESFFSEYLGFESVSSIDYSAYENATIIQNISEPLRHDLYAKFDLVVDGGTLEHVFNVAQGFKNLIMLAKVGGWIYTHSPCNSMSGHGFYQFSPELAFRMFSHENGCLNKFVRISVAKSLSVERTLKQPVLEVTDPLLSGTRVLLASKHPTILMSLSQRIDDVIPFEKPVLQSDYVGKWSESEKLVLNRNGRMLNKIGEFFPTLPQFISNFREMREGSIRNRKHYKPVVYEV